LLAEVPHSTLQTPLGAYPLYGGHRVWHAPEVNPRTYLADDHGLVVESIAGGVRLTGALETYAGIRKSIEVRLEAEQPVVHLKHTLVNEGAWTVELAPWSITMLPLGGVAVIPFAAPPADPDGLQPNRTLAVWPYTQLTDPRLVFSDEFLLVRGVGALPPLKLGVLQSAAPEISLPGWLVYWDGVYLFVKRFEVTPGVVYPDRGVNAEVYCGDQVLELEALGALQPLLPGTAATLHESWEIRRGLSFFSANDPIRLALESILPPA
jgi:hypothetical protein